MKLYRTFKEVLEENFKSQKQRFLKQGYDADIIKSYFERFKFIKDKGYSELKDPIEGVSVKPEQRNNIDAYKDFRDLERVVDYVGGRRSVATSMKADNNIEVSGEAIYNKDGVEVFYADNPRACVKYKGKMPYSWCVARSDASNMFYTYRFRENEPAFYFVKDVEATKEEIAKHSGGFKGKFENPYHFVVIQVPKFINPEDDDRKQYIVTSANNNGDIEMSWNEIKKLNPKFAPIKEILKPKPFTPEEKERHQRFKSGISDREFAKLSYEEKKDYLSIYPAAGRGITDVQFAELPDDLMNLYVSYGIGLSEEQDKLVKTKPKIYKRYAAITRRKYDEYVNAAENWTRRNFILNYSELRTLPEHEIESYLSGLSKSELRKLAHSGGWEAMDFINQRMDTKEKEDDGSYATIYNLLRNIHTDEALNQLNEMVPDGVEINADGNHIVFDFWDVSRHKRLEDYVGMEYDTHYMFDGSLNYANHQDNYYDGWEEGLEDDYNRYIKDLVSSNRELENDFKFVGLDYNEETVKDVINSYGFEDRVKEEIIEKVTEASNEAKSEAGDELQEEVNKYITMDESKKEMSIDVRSLAIYLKSHELFSTDEETFKHYLEGLPEEILEMHDLPTGWDTVYEAIDDHNMVVDTNRLLSDIEDIVKYALDAYAEDELDDEHYDEYEDNKNPNVKRLKSDVIAELRKTLSGMGLNPDQNEFENQLVRIDIARNRVRLDNQVYIKLVNKNSGKELQGFVPIESLPTHFSNYKLFDESLHRIKNRLTEALRRRR